MGSRWSGVTICQGKKLVQTKHQNWDHQHTAGRFDKNQRSSFLLGRRRSRVLPAGCRFVALAMKRKHDESMDLNELNELRRRAGELVARAGLENGGVKDLLFAEKKDVCGLNR